MKKKHKIYQLKSIVGRERELIGGINELLEHLSPNNYSISQDRLEELLGNQFLEIYLLEEDQEIVGMGSIHFTKTLVKKAAWLEDIVVHPKRRGKRFGEKIMKHLIDRARKSGVKHIDLTSRNDREKAHKFYEALNFEKRETSVFRMKLRDQTE